MRARAASWRRALGESLWFIPAVCTTLAVVLSVALVELDKVLRLDQRNDAIWWLTEGGPDGTRGVLSAIAGTMITVTGVVFSVTIVALQLASSQFTPRVLRRFRADRGNQLVLGVFIATFTYALLVLRAVRSPIREQEAFVPVVAATGAIVLVLVSIAFLIYFVHHMARSIQASTIIDRAANDTLGLIRRLFPDDIGRPAVSALPPALPVLPGATVNVTDGGYFQSVNADILFDLSEKWTLTVRVEPRVGEFLLPGAVLATIWPATSLDNDLENSVRETFVLGPERTLQSDIELGLRQMADIGIKALSPAINDPTTAMICIDRLSEALVHFARRVRPWPVRSGNDGSVRVILGGPSFADLTEVAFAQIRHYGAGDAIVAAHLARTLGRMQVQVPAEHRAILAREGRLVLESARQQIAIEADVERVERAAAWAAESENKPGC